jgi:chromosome segregation ATPase
MQPLTRQEMQTAMQQLVVNITNQAATKQDLNRAITTINQQSSAQLQADMARILNQYCERIIDKAYQEFKQQNITMQQINNKLDTNSKRLAAYEQSLASIQASLVGAQKQIDDLAYKQHQAVTKEMAAQEAKTERTYAQKTVFGGLFG